MDLSLQKTSINKKNQSPQMKGLLVNFNNEQKLIIKNTLSNTSFRDSVFFDSNNIEEAAATSNWDDLDVIIKFISSEEEINWEYLNHLAEELPVLFITEKLIDIPGNYNKLFDYLPITEISSFVLERNIIQVIEKTALRKKLNEFQSNQTELTVNEEKFRNIFENSSVGMYEIDPNGNFVLANKVFLNILGLNDISELKELNAFQSGLSTSGLREILKKKIFDEKAVNNFEDEWLRADKTKVVVKEHLRAKINSDGEIEYFLGVVEDITERKRVESELVKSKKDAEKSDRLKSEFLTQISHEIRTPVNTLLNFSALIEEELKESLSDDLKDCFGSMHRAGNRIIRTIDLLIKMSELHTDNYEPVFEEHNLFELLDELYIKYKPMAEEKGIDLQFIKVVDDANIIYDKLTMYDVFSNIIDNAIKYTDKGDVKIYVKNTLLNKKSVTIIDTGIGISEKYLGSIFQPFSQETSGYTRKFDGNGLGLALVKEYCELNNAEIFVSSEKGAGSNFTVIFK
jgi:PAS domain S-box-containing protein